MNRILMLLAVAALTAGSGCERSSKPSAPSTASDATATSGAGDKPGGDASQASEHGGAVVELGETSVDGMVVRASRDAGPIKAGGDAPIDIWVDGGLGDAVAVRFWIGTADAKGSIKAKAAVENAHWHTHGEIPDPLPADSKLWVEIERKGGTKAVASFDLRS